MKRISEGILRFRPAETSFGFSKKGWLFRLLSPLDSSLRSVLMAIIVSYQRYLSPRKGYSCAHRIVHGGDSCSQYVKKTLADKNLFESTLLAKKRFEACNTVYTSSKNRFAESRGSVMASVGPDPTEPIGCIIAIVVAILVWISKKSGCSCK